MRARSLAEAFDALDRHGEEARLLAGGQSLIPALNLRLATPAVLVDINGLAGLAGIALQGGVVRIGALTRHAALEASEIVARHLPLLAEAVPQIAHPAIRSRGTLGGSIALADPAAELPACALALDATIVAMGRAGERRIAARDFFRGLYQTDLQPGELVAAVEFPVQPPERRGCVLELARRQGDYAIVGLAAAATVQGDGALRDPRLVFFGVGPTPVRAAAAEAALAGAGGVAAAQAALERDLDPPADLHGPPQFRRHLARVLLGRAAARLLG
nr:xanthine dehydrogenase family protein subunit M [Caldovatus aquaticus]